MTMGSSFPFLGLIFSVSALKGRDFDMRASLVCLKAAGRFLHRRGPLNNG